MKKLICLLIMLMCVWQITGFAKIVDLSDMSREELIELREKIDKLLDEDEKNELSVSSWYDYGLGKYLPNPSEVLGRVVESDPIAKINTDSSFYETIENAMMDDFNTYVQTIKEFGYVENVQTYGTGYFAVMNGKYQVGVVYVDFPAQDYPDHITVTVDIIK